MKRKVLAILVPALLMAGAAHAAEMYNKNGNKVDLYGKIDARHTFSDHPGDDGDETYVQIGFKGETQITNDVIGYGQWEYKTYANNTEDAGDTSFNRLAYAGLKYGEYGSFDYGRNYGVVYDVEAWTDMLPVFGGDSYTWTDNFMVGRANGVATYRNADFFGLVEGLNFALQYQGANEGQDATEDQEGTKNGHNDVRFQNGDGFGMSTSYDFSGDLSGLTLGAAYSSSDRTNEQEAKGIQDSARFAGGKTAEVWTVGAKYDANSVYLAMMYAQTRNMTPYGDTGIADETQNFEAVAQYQFDFGLRPSLAWVYSKGKDMTYPGNAGNPQGQHGDMDLVNYIDVGMTYSFNKNFSTYVDYKINMLDNDESFYEANGISTDDIVGVGMTYQF
ncbi:TPA: porin OmpC [Enterobacter ludwigii]|jgi:outer membrane protein N|uniref:porin OmpC n=1 Tax=Enterobacter TaxID=547 RepID=UPI0005CFE7D4|nr:MULTISPECIES: porin OmpC [Enterobacter]AWC85854.1 porin OmpC [Enterobacter cloacae complex sp. FDA-CDC-AR_0164]EKS7195601.1 porin OmpC [Enterobacter ludwigii]EKS7208814.1 porin OmpC [Enterobacter ludwigii]ELK6195350.1 porin OmpC [Enterobacter ludwigii]KAA0520097.1 porin [Enterobacter ludwigii]